MRIIFLLLCLLIIGCDSSSTVAYDRGYKFTDEKTQEEYIKELEKEKMPHTISYDKSVNYSSKDEPKMREIIAKFLDNPSEPYTCYFDKKREEKFLNALDLGGIKYEIREKSLGLCVTWKKEDDEQVKAIKDHLFKPTAWFDNLNSEQNFLKKLEKESISYSIFEEDGHRKISWSQEDEPKVDAIYEEIKKERIEKMESSSSASPYKVPQENMKEEKIYPDGSKSTVGTDFLQIPFEPHMCYFDEERLKQFTDILGRENIGYEIKTTKLGLAKCVTWSEKDDYRIKQITKRMFNPSGWFGNLEKEKNFLEKMEEAKIEYTMYEEEGNRKISWSREDEKRADQVYESLVR